ncbi:hypothetical protein AB0G06_20025 [Nonomuraea dietziae]|uniref:hypothetical protein n=1 Tax=Nonomuraea dietziae TaxID=65515 RepID=UPI0033C39C3F
MRTLTLHVLLQRPKYGLPRSSFGRADDAEEPDEAEEADDADADPASAADDDTGAVDTEAGATAGAVTVLETAPEDAEATPGATNTTDAAAVRTAILLNIKPPDPPWTNRRHD